MRIYIFVFLFCFPLPSFRQSSELPNIQIPEMVFVEGGTFTMGCTSEQVNDCSSAEKPSFQAEVSDFLIGKYEVTNGEYCEFLNDISVSMSDISKKRWIRIGKKNYKKYEIYQSGNKYMVKMGFTKYPVCWVSWLGAVAYCEWLSQKTGRKYRLPTEMEWEYVARGGKNGKNTKYSGSNDVDSVSWYSCNSKHRTHLVGHKLPNEVGVYDLSGNIWEWCLDSWYYYSKKRNADKIYKNLVYTGKKDTDILKVNTSDISGTFRILRGGGWSNKTTNSLRVSNRMNDYPTSRGHYCGFRVVRE